MPLMRGVLRRIRLAGWWHWRKDPSGRGGGRGGRTCRKIVVFSGEARPEEALHQLGGVLVKRLPLLNAAVVELPEETGIRAAVELPAELPAITRVDDDLVIHIVGDEGLAAVLPPLPNASRVMRCIWRRWVIPAPEQTIPWGVKAIGARKAWSRTKGEGVRVAVIDTGIDLEHPDLKQNIAGGYNTLDPAAPPLDDNGHGTHVAGVIAAVDNRAGVVGVAPQASLYAVKALDAYGMGYLSDLIEGLDWCIRNGIEVVNMSLGTAEENQSFREAIKRAYEAGVVLVAAAGNEGQGADTVTYPARYPETLAVSAIDANNRMPPFASRGPSVGVLAPGVGVYSTWPGRRYRSLDGTSMAAPHVSAVAAMVLATHQGMTPDQVKNHIKASARRVAGLKYPVVDAYKAVAT